MDELEVARPDEHRDDRQPTRGEHLRLVGMEGRGRDEVVVELVETLGQVVDQRALGFDHAGERVDQPLGVVAGVGAGAFGEEDPDEGSRSLAFGRRGEGRRGDLVGGETGVRSAPQQLGDDACQCLAAATLRRSIGDVGPGPVPARDVPAVRQPAVDRPDRVRVDAQRGAELTDRRQAGAGQQPSRIDLVGELPEDLGRDRDVRVALDVEAAPGSHRCGDRRRAGVVSIDIAR